MSARKLHQRLAAAALLVWALAGGASCRQAESRRAWTMVTFGDSTTAPREVDGKPLTVYADILRTELPARGLKADVINAGVRGNTTADAAQRFAKDVLSREPDIVVIQFGANDAMVDVWKDPPVPGARVPIDEYEQHLRTFVRTLRERGAHVILMTPNPFRWTAGLKRRYGKPPYRPEDPDGLNTLLRTYAARVRLLASAEDVALVDVCALFDAYGRVDGQRVHDLLLDGIHPNEAGHRLVADELLEAIGCMILDDSTAGRSGR